MKALSIRQPWAWAILHAGKDIENRNWTPRNPALQFRGHFLIHASQGMTRREYDDFVHVVTGLSSDGPYGWPEDLKVPAFGDLPRGGIVGCARVDRIVRSHHSPWFAGPWGIVISEVRVRPFVPFKGMLGFFDVLADAVSEQCPHGGNLTPDSPRA